MDIVFISRRNNDPSLQILVILHLDLITVPYSNKKPPLMVVFCFLAF